MYNMTKKVSVYKRNQAAKKIQAAFRRYKRARYKRKSHADPKYKRIRDREEHDSIDMKRPRLIRKLRY